MILQPSEDYLWPPITGKVKKGKIVEETEEKDPIGLFPRLWRSELMMERYFLL